MAKEEKEEEAALSVDDQLAKLKAEKETFMAELRAEKETFMADMRAEKERLEAENAALVAENEGLTATAEVGEETYEDWTDDEWVNPRARPVPKRGDWANVRWRDTGNTESPRKVLIAGTIVKDKFVKGKKPKDSKTFFWNRDPTKLALREVDLEKGPARIHFGEVIELTPHLIQRNRGYIEDGSLGPRRRLPVRRSVKTRQVIASEKA